MQYAVTSVGFTDGSQPGQPLPVGDYLICYKLFEVEASSSNVLASECITIFAEPLSPPQLIQPENQGVIRELRPVLSWTPPAPVQMFANLNYDLVVAIVYENQSPEEAIQRNIPVLTTISSTNSLLYPSSQTNLETGKTYAWQISARDGGRFGGKSEVWTFTIMPDSIAKIISSAPYIKLKKDNTQATVLHQNTLKIEYFNPLPDSIIQVEIYKANGGKNRAVETFSTNLKRGQNYLEHNLKGRLHESEIYEVKIVNSRNEIWMMRFTPKYYL
jgi:hypothetical protein